MTHKMYFCGSLLNSIREFQVALSIKIARLYIVKTTAKYSSCLNYSVAQTTTLFKAFGLAGWRCMWLPSLLKMTTFHKCTCLLTLFSTLTTHKRCLNRISYPLCQEELCSLCQPGHVWYLYGRRNLANNWIWQHWWKIIDFYVHKMSFGSVLYLRHSFYKLTHSRVRGTKTEWKFNK